jgi:hypothetical protein
MCANALVSANVRHKWRLGDTRSRLRERGGDKQNSEGLYWPNKKVLIMVGLVKWKTQV